MTQKEGMKLLNNKNKRVFGIAAIFLVLVSAFVLASHVITNSASTTVFYVVEDVSVRFNISVYNTDVGDTANITQVNITMPDGFILTSDTNGTSAGISHNFTNYSSLVLSWTNDTYYLVNGSNDSATNADQRIYFWFNATPTQPGYYNISVWTANTTGAFNTNLTVLVNDTTAPYFNETLTNTSVIFNRSFITLVNGTDNYIFGSYAVNDSRFTIVAATGLLYNSSALPAGLYYLNVSINDSTGNSNSTLVLINLTKINGNVTLYLNHSEANATINDGDSIWLNATIQNGDSGTLRLYVNGSLVNSEALNVGTQIKNLTTFTISGRHNISAYYDGGQNFTSNWTVRWVWVNDVRSPQVEIGSITENHGTNFSRDWIFLNASVTEANFTNITFLIYNSTTVVNETTFTDTTRTINWTSLPNEVYTYNYTVCDGAARCNTSSTRKLTLDTVPPAVVLTRMAANSTEEKITLSISITDSMTGVNSSCLTNRGNVSGTGTSQYATNTGIFCSNTYSFTITCTDYAGNNNPKTQSFATDDCAGGSSGSGGGGGTSVWTNTYSATEVQLEGGYEKNLGEKERVRVTFEGAPHHVGVIDITTTSVKIEISSTPQQTTLFVGDTKKFEVSGDNYYDLSVKLNSLSGTKADLTITKIHEEMPATTTPGASEEESIDESAGEQAPSDVETIKTQKKMSATTAILILVLVVVLVVIAIRLTKHSRKNRRRHYYSK